MDGGIAMKQDKNAPRSETGGRPTHRLAGWTSLFMIAPSVVYLVATTQWPFVQTLYFSLFRWQLNVPSRYGFVGLANYEILFSDARILPVFANTLVLTVSVVFLSIALGCVLALLLNREFLGRNIFRTVLFSPFLVMPVVTAVIWKNILLDPVYGIVNWLLAAIGIGPVNFFTDYPMASVIAMTTWEWTPFAMLILLTGLQSLPQDQIEAARLDGAEAVSLFRYITLPHLRRFVQLIATLETIFVIQVFGEIYTATGGGPGTSTSNIPYLLYAKGFFEYNVGAASATAVVAVILVNLVSLGVIRSLGSVR